ncbi:hypothetical protein JOD20_002711 [Herpetosiphon giganteus]|nr:hypothetical protein [Herpetosiphon giganteus]
MYRINHSNNQFLIQNFKKFLLFVMTQQFKPSIIAALIYTIHYIVTQTPAEVQQISIVQLILLSWLFIFLPMNVIAGLIYTVVLWYRFRTKEVNLDSYRKSVALIAFWVLFLWVGLAYWLIIDDYDHTKILTFILSYLVQCIFQFYFIPYRLFKRYTPQI